MVVVRFPDPQSVSGNFGVFVEDEQQPQLIHTPIPPAIIAISSPHLTLPMIIIIPCEWKLNELLTER